MDLKMSGLTITKVDYKNCKKCKHKLKGFKWCEFSNVKPSNKTFQLKKKFVNDKNEVKGKKETCKRVCAVICEKFE